MLISVNAAGVNVCTCCCHIDEINNYETIHEYCPKCNGPMKYFRYDGWNHLHPDIYPVIAATSFNPAKNIQKEKSVFTGKDLNLLIQEVFDKIAVIIGTKGVEYTRGTKNRLSNFYEVATELNLTPQQVLMVLLKKHLRTLDHFCAGAPVLSESLESRIIDCIVYLLLLLGMSRVEEEKEKP